MSLKALNSKINQQVEKVVQDTDSIEKSSKIFQDLSEAELAAYDRAKSVCWNAFNNFTRVWPVANLWMGHGMLF